MVGELHVRHLEVEIDIRGEAPGVLRLDHLAAVLLEQLPGGVAGAGPELQAFLRCVPWLLAFAGIWMLPVVWLTIFGASRLDPVRVAIFLMLEIVVGVSTAALLAGEPFGARELAGAVLILGASGVEITAKRRPDS